MFIMSDSPGGGGARRRHKKKSIEPSNTVVLPSPPSTPNKDGSMTFNVCIVINSKVGISYWTLSVITKFPVM